MTEKAVLRVKELAAYLGIGLNSAYELVRQPGFPAIRIGKRKIIVPIEALENWMNSNTKKF